MFLEHQSSVTHSAVKMCCLNPTAVSAANLLASFPNIPKTTTLVTHSAWRQEVTEPNGK
jgi:hypothetical protein